MYLRDYLKKYLRDYLKKKKKLKEADLVFFSVKTRIEKLAIFLTICNIYQP